MLATSLFLFREVMTSLSDFLGEKPFLLGKEPCLADLSMFGFVTMVRILTKEKKWIEKS